ncbi:MAG: SRPBCC domain-containing protein [Candidatus Methylomirabilia bacterium]
MGSPKHRPETTLLLRRTFAAPPDKVFRAWTDPEELKKWWGPEGYSTPTAEVDLRAGGTYRFGMKKLPDGDLFYLAGTFREVRPREKLVYTWSWEGQPLLGDTVVTVEFHDRGGSTEVVLTHEFFPNENVRDDHVKGWSSGLDRLANAM